MQKLLKDEDNLLSNDDASEQLNDSLNTNQLYQKVDPDFVIFRKDSDNNAAGSDLGGLSFHKKCSMSSPNNGSSFNI